MKGTKSVLDIDTFRLGILQQAIFAQFLFLSTRLDFSKRYIYLRQKKQVYRNTTVFKLA